jgi:hypothetical protein
MVRAGPNHCAAANGGIAAAGLPSARLVVAVAEDVKRPKAWVVRQHLCQR